MKTCARCGKTLPEENFRHYYNNRKGTYRYCKMCESIEARRRYLASQDSLTATQSEELDKINKLYDARFAAGLSVPKRSVGIAEVRNKAIEEELSKYEV